MQSAFKKAFFFKFNCPVWYILHFPQGITIMLKFWALLLAYALIICQMYISEAAPSR